ncbi:hypothetical protein I6A60_12425 [Frankia sp. AgB1.9]|uniref:hypothetical protein n=1 Tax=unclassified Frankia TaxID=2632575 RepID=UPI001934A251|nr:MULTISPECIES: hypothetical protein [unclassified Frankia]MBL7548675.1 hypothetical protein [Frankia sp. AgB1.9]MBL7619273.1 hypothetical protein [Frankia sp. AgB1.8]
MPPRPSEQARPGHVTLWPSNAAGETYGSDLAALFPGNRPDLISAWTTDWKSGYIRRTEVDAATGAHLPPSELSAWNMNLAEREAAGQPNLIPVYEQDGVTIIGSFAIDSGRVGRRGRVLQAATPAGETPLIASDGPVRYYYGGHNTDEAPDRPPSLPNLSPPPTLPNRHPGPDVTD